MYLVSRKETFAKLFFLLSFSGLLMYIVLAFYTFHTAFFGITKTENTRVVLDLVEPDAKRFENDIKYILLWTIPEMKSKLKKDGQQLFISNNCSYLNCYLTMDKDLLYKDVRNFNAIIFNINTLMNWETNMPKKRNPKQKYVFYSMVAADMIPICNKKADGFFNWTWTYKLYSDIVTPFIEVRDKNGEITAPKYNNWTYTNEDVESLEVTTIDIFNKNVVNVGNKTKALMWYMRICNIDKKVVQYVGQLQQALKEHDLTFDIYGCGYQKCTNQSCFKSLDTDYYFYLAMEDSYSEDYVTGEVLKALHHNVVPIVIGGADYSKFLPFKSYIDATSESIDRLAAIIQYNIQNPPAYSSYFTWKNLFTINEVNLQRGYCDLCAMLNNREKVERTSVYRNFRTWWFYGSLKDRCYPQRSERLEGILPATKDDKKSKISTPKN